MSQNTLFLFLLIFAIICVIITVKNVSIREPIMFDSTTQVGDILNMVRSNYSLIDPKYSRIPLTSGTSAYTEDKKRICLCVKDPESQAFYNYNTIMYVALHELAHLSSKSFGHNEEFKLNFAKLLKLGENIGFYNPNIPLPKKICGVS